MSLRAPGRHRRWRILFALAITTAAALSIVNSAAASEPHPFITSFGFGVVGNPYGVAVDTSSSVSSGDVYVANDYRGDGGPPINKFDPNGAALGHIDDSNLVGCPGANSMSGGVFAVSVDPANGNLFASSFRGGQVIAFSPTGQCLFFVSVPGPLGIAVDPSHNALYVSDSASGEIKTFALSNGAPISSFGSGFQSVLGIAVDSVGNVFVMNAGTHKVEEYSPSGVCLNSCTPVDSNGTDGVAVNPTDGHIFVAEFESSPDNQIAEYATPTESPPLNVFAQKGTERGYIFGMAAGNSRLYVADYFGAKVEVYQLAPLAHVTTEPATGVGQTTAILHGALDPGEGGDVTDCQFEYGIDSTYGSTVPCAEGTSFTSPATVHADLSGLTVESHYHYRLVATDENGTSYGVDHVVTPHAVFGLSTEPATNLSRTSANLNGRFEGNGEHTHYYFEWGTDTSYGHMTPVEDAGSPSAAQQVAKTFNLEGLTAEVVYHFRFVAENAVGTTRGDDQEFETYGAVEGLSTEPATNVTAVGATLHGSFIGNGEDTHYYFDWGTDTSYGHQTAVPPGTDAGNAAGAQALGFALGGLVPETTYHFRIVASNSTGTTFGLDQSFTTLQAVRGLKTEAPSGIGPTSAQLNASYVGIGVDTHYFFEWGQDQSYGHTTSAPPGSDAGAGTGPTALLFQLTGLDPVTTYHYRVVATDVDGTTYGTDESFTTPPSAPLVTETVGGVHSESAELHATINPGGGATTYHFEYATDQEFNAGGGAYGNVLPIPDGELAAGSVFVPVSTHLGNLAPGTIYHWRVVASNITGSTDGPDRTFSTFPFAAVLDDLCDNSHVRQQTGATQLLDCRAYELVSAAKTGGYDVISDLVPNQAPYPGYPEAENPSRVLYSIRDGGIPGTNHPTNRGPDPYIATRGEAGWTTQYVGVPADNPFATQPFSSVLSGADAQLETFSFGGPEGCSPCFEGGYTGIPIHLPNGSLVQGMSGPESSGPAAMSDGYVAASLSANGEHFIFGSTSRFAPGGNSGGDVSIYDHNLKSGATHVVSNTPTAEDFPEAIPCLQGAGKCNSANSDSNGIAELGISGDGSRILIGQKVATDADGNVYWHLYMDIDDSVKSVDVTPGAVHGVLFDGMKADGSQVFFTTIDKLVGTDTDTSADLFKATIGPSSAVLTQISTGIGGAGNTDSCDPTSSAGIEHWNEVGVTPDCGVLGIGGGGGVGTSDGSVFFLSPEKLEGPGNGALDQPNLYIAKPGAQPHFIATLDPADRVVVMSLKSNETRQTANFEVAPSGEFASFTTDRRFGAYENAGFAEVYRYDALTDALDCASCNPSNSEAAGNASMAGSGVSLSEDGRVFFNSNDALVLGDADSRQDVYEWEPQGTGNCQPDNPAFFAEAANCVSLISSGAGQFGSSLLGVTLNGRDAYLFTRETLTPEVENGRLVKIYDARELGGFPFVPAEIPCKASDECHGAGSPIPPSPTINSAAGSGGNAVAEGPPKCRSGFVRRHGKCVRRHRKHKHHRGGKK